MGRAADPPAAWGWDARLARRAQLPRPQLARYGRVRPVVPEVEEVVIQVRGPQVRVVPQPLAGVGCEPSTSRGCCGPARRPADRRGRRGQLDLVADVQRQRRPDVRRRRADQHLEVATRHVPNTFDSVPAAQRVVPKL